METDRLYDTSIVIELISRDRITELDGYVTIYTVVEYPPVLTVKHKIIYPSKEDYERAISWQVELREKGNPLPAVDLIIAAIAYNKGYELVTKDRHFKMLEQLVKDIRLSIV